MNQEREQLLKLVNQSLLCSIHRYKYVKLTTCDNEVVEGWLKGIDPPTTNVVLVTFDEDTFEMKNIILVFGKNIKRMKILKQSNPNAKSALEKLYAPPEATEVDMDRRDRLIAFIKAHRCPFEVIEDGQSLLVINEVTIRPPYIFESCLSSNGNVLRGIKRLLERFDSQNALEKADSPVRNEAISSPELSTSKREGNMPYELSSTHTEAVSFKKFTFNENPTSSSKENVNFTMSSEGEIQKETETNFSKKATSSKDANFKSSMPNVNIRNSSRKEVLYCKETQLKPVLKNVAAGDSSRKGAWYNKDVQLKSTMENVAVADSSWQEDLSGKDVNLKSAIPKFSDKFPASEGARNKSTTKMLLFKNTIDEVKRKDELMSWIKLNECPVREVEGSQALLVCECVTVHQPYEVECCTSTCEVILRCIRKLVRRGLLEIEKSTSAYSASSEEYDFDKLALSSINRSPNPLSMGTSSDESSSSIESACGELPYLRKLVPDAECAPCDADTSSEESTSTEESFEIIVKRSNSTSKKDVNMPFDSPSTSVKTASYEKSAFNENPTSSCDENVKSAIQNVFEETSKKKTTSSIDSLLKSSTTIQSVDVGDSPCKEALSNNDGNLKSTVETVVDEDSSGKENLSCNDAQMKSAMQSVAVKDSSCKIALLGKDLGDSSGQKDLSGMDLNLKSAIPKLADEYPSSEGARNKSTAKMLLSENTMAVVKRKDELMSWIKSYEFPVREIEGNEVLLVCECVTIYAPYVVESCTSTCKIVLRSIRELVYRFKRRFNFVELMLDAEDMYVSSASEETSSDEESSCSSESVYGNLLQMKSVMQSVAVKDSSCKIALLEKDLGDSSGQKDLSGMDLNLKSAIPKLANKYPSSKGARNKSTAKMLLSENTMAVVKRKDELMSWIKSYECPVREIEGNEVLLVCECVTIYAPYVVESCTSTCKIVLRSIRELVYRFKRRFNFVELMLDAEDMYLSSAFEESSSDEKSSCSSESVYGELSYLRKLVPDTESLTESDAVSSSEESSSAED